MNIALTPRLALRVDRVDGDLKGLLYLDGLPMRGVVSVCVDFGRPNLAHPALAGTVALTLMRGHGREPDAALVDELEAVGVEVDVVDDVKLLGAAFDGMES